MRHLVVTSCGCGGRGRLFLSPNFRKGGVFSLALHFPLRTTVQLFCCRTSRKHALTRARTLVTEDTKMTRTRNAAPKWVRFLQQRNPLHPIGHRRPFFKNHHVLALCYRSEKVHWLLPQKRFGRKKLSNIVDGCSYIASIYDAVLSNSGAVPPSRIRIRFTGKKPGQKGWEIFRSLPPLTAVHLS